MATSYPISRYLLSVMRIVIAFTFTCHGAQKLLGAFGGMGPHGGTVPLFSLFWFAGIIEMVCGTLLFFGLLTRPVALILCGEMAVAYFHAHAPRGPWPLRNGGELAVVYCFVFLYLLAAGPGPISLDRVLRRKEV